MSLLEAIKLIPQFKTHRYAVMIGLYSFLWKLVNRLLQYFRQTGPSKLNGAIAGGVAGLAIMVESREVRVNTAQQLLARGLQAGYNSLKARELFYFPSGDVLMFSLACGSALYSYSFYPSSIPPDLYSFMVKMAGVPKKVLETFRAHMLGGLATGRYEANLPVWKEAIQSVNHDPQVLDIMTRYAQKHQDTLPKVPCQAIHPSDIYCSRYSVNLFRKVFMTILPVYFSLNLVPLAVFKPQKLLQAPLPTLKRLIVSTCKSSTFLGLFVSSFQVAVCASRAISPDQVDNRFWYYVFGMLSGLSVLLEEKHRRAELAMYIGPKGLTSLYRLMIQRGRMVRIPHVEVIGCCMATSMIMSVYQVEPHQMSTLLYKVMSRVIGTD